MKKISCPNCGNQFNRKSPAQKFCCPDCRKAAYIPKPIRLGEDICIVENCSEIAQTLEMCRRHYQQQWFKKNHVPVEPKNCINSECTNRVRNRGDYCSDCKSVIRIYGTPNKPALVGECKRCGAIFEAVKLTTPPQVYCSAECRKKEGRTKKKISYTNVCEQCGLESVGRKKRFCSNSCRNKFYYVPKVKQHKNYVSPPEGMAAIYYLRRTDTDEVIYIGSTKDAYSSRLARHKSSHRPVIDLKPFLDIVKIEPIILVPIKDQFKWESLAIQTARELGWPLVNKKLP